MRRVKATCAALLAAALVGCGPTAPRARTIAALQGVPVRGAALFQTSCAGCHKAEGFTKMLAWFPESAFLSTVVTGVPKTRMPAFAALSDQQIADIYAYLRKPPK